MKLHSKENWYLNDPTELITYLHWLKNQITTDKEIFIKQGAEQLNKSFPCPEEHKAKWGLK